MSILRLFATFAGRIPRVTWWLGMIALLVVSVLGDYLLQPELFDITTDAPPPPPSLAVNIWGLLVMTASAALTVKRLNDRDWPNWVNYAALAWCASLAVAPFFGVLTNPDALGTFDLWFVAVVFPIALWLFIDNGFFRGTDGPNSHGPDPLQR